MGTKANPGKFDCYAKLEPHEPHFVLKATDPFAPHLVEMWAALRDGDVYELIEAFGRVAANRTALIRALAKPVPEKTQEARACAEAMQQWHEERNTDAVGPHPFR